VEKLVYGGDGLARLDGRVVLAPYVLPGERIRAVAEQEKPALVRARALEVLEPAPERIPPRCRYFERCGGCHYQHAPYALQLDAKRAILEEELRRIGRFEPPGEIGVVQAEPWHYRNRAQFRVENGCVGYRAARSHALCPVEECPIVSPRVGSVLATLGEMAREPRWPRFLEAIEVFTDETQVQLNVLETGRPVARRFFDWCAERIPGLVSGALDYEGYRVSGRSFFQVNRHLVQGLVDAALEGAVGETAHDLYSGVGLFTLPLARRFAQVTAVESGTSAVHDLEHNAACAGLVNIRAWRGTTEDWLEALEHAPDFVLLDPPRAGLGKAVVRRLAALAPPRVTIAACDPSTLARDLADLLTAGYRIERMTLVDLFPQTYHLETVVHLAR
jgi:23S rRNA (uracil1939-C5)-methyltransferase